MTERRFNEAEVAAIFKRAAEAQNTSQEQLPSGQGLTLTELRQIARDVGIAPDLVEQASQVVARAGTPTSRKFLGMPIGVGRTIDLGRKMTDDEWARLVVDLRETFDAKGVVRQDGPLRQWTNGNLQALLEPTATGHRVRLRTVKGDARGLMAAGVGIFTAGVISLVAGVMQGAGVDAGALGSLGVMAVSGVGVFGAGALRLPSWARTRQQQMNEIAERLAAVITSGTGPKRLPEDL